MPNGVFHDLALSFCANELCYGPGDIILMAASDGIYQLDPLLYRYEVYVPELKGKRVNAVAYEDGYLVVAVRGEGLWVRKDGIWENVE